MIEPGETGLFHVIRDPEKPLNISKEVLLVGNKTSPLTFLGKPLPTYNATSVFSLSWERLRKGKEYLSSEIEQFAMDPVGVLRKEVDGLRESIQKDRSRKWPIFIREDASSYRYWRLLSKAKRLDRPLIEKTTNQKMKEYVRLYERGKHPRIFTIRVLFRVMDKQLALLARYNHSHNNICMTDFENGTLRKLTEIEARNNQNSVKSIAKHTGESEQAVHHTLSVSSYDLYIEDVYYCHQCVDQLTAIRALLKSNKVPNQTFWKTTQIPTLRSTLFPDEQEAHFVVMDEYWPGAGGKLFLGKQDYLEKCEKEFWNKNKPIRIDNLDQYSRALHHHIENLSRESLRDYLTLPTIGKKNLKLTSVEKYLSKILSWDYEQIIQYAKQGTTSRERMICELKDLQLAIIDEKMKYQH